MSAPYDQTITRFPSDATGAPHREAMIVARTRGELAAARDPMPGAVAVVMTMGALHDGHEALLRAARAGGDHLIVTIFVNPLQFGPTEDFGRYPRSLDADLEICRRAGVDLVFAPTAEEMYPAGEPLVRVNPGPLGERLEGASRPGFFHGVLTVVLKLLQLTRPHRAYFGEKDYQQLTLVRRMVRDLDIPVQILGVPTVREVDGLALSSRNRYLSPDQRAAALALSRALHAGAAAAGRGLAADGILAAARQGFAEGTPDARLDYLVLTDPELGPAPAAGPARMLVAAWVGPTRLIDNVPVEVHG
jgi:pantoate--beta-alanine ligase